MSVRKRSILSITVLEVSGSFFGDVETEQLASEVAAAASSGNLHLILDLADCRVMNSTALSVLTQAYRDYSARGGAIRLCGVQKRMESILTLTRLLDFFRHYPSVDEALASFAEAESAA
jgi:anti-anti-sigma factor